MFSVADRDGDELLTEEEFACLQVGEGGETLLSQGEAERREEFRSFLDIDKDGKADKKEIVVIFNLFYDLLINLTMYLLFRACVTYNI